MSFLEDFKNLRIDQKALEAHADLLHTSANATLNRNNRLPSGTTNEHRQLFVAKSILTAIPDNSTWRIAILRAAFDLDHCEAEWLDEFAQWVEGSRSSKLF